MTASKKTTKKHATKSAKTTTCDAREGSILQVATTKNTSPEVSTPAPTPVTTAAPAPASVAAAPSFTPPGDLPPAVEVPSPPAGWVPAPKKKRSSARGSRPKGVQTTTAQAVAKELTGSATYSADFGSHVPAAAQVAFVMTNAAKWRATWQAARNYFVYASQQRATWENDALAQMDTLKPAFQYAASRDSAVTAKYSATAKYLDETSEIAERAVTVRKENAKAKAKAAGGTATAAAPAVSPAPVAK